MPVYYHEKSRTYHVCNDTISYIIKVLDDNKLAHLYYGARVQDKSDFDYLLEGRRRPMSAYPTLNESKYSIEHIKQEFPTFGSGDYRYDALALEQDNGSHVLDFRWHHHTITQGKSSIPNLPATYSNDASDCTTLCIYLVDEVLACSVCLTYTIFKNIAIITRNSSITYEGSDTLTITKCMSASFDLADDAFEVSTLTGAWARERHKQTYRVPQGSYAIESLRGHSSHQFNPFLALSRSQTSEHSGEVYGFSFVYSGNFIMHLDTDTYHTTRVSIGIHPKQFSWTLKSQETFHTPEVILAYSKHGWNDLSKQFHILFNQHLVREPYKNKVRPILINNWEATYFDFNEAKLVALASEAKKLGIEMFVLDDGWFGSRNSDLAGLGDWFVNDQKLVSGLVGFSQKIHAMGMQFGIWIEPEMVNLDSLLYRNHPNWVLRTPHRPWHHSRNQYVLDFSNPEVVDYIYNQLYATFHQVQLDYIKWDMNRSMADVYSSYYPANQQGEVMHRYMLGVYQLYERLRIAFPNILFESCASGGGRFDPGMLYYAPQTWTSDNTDAIERLKIQYGTSLVYPLSSIGSHVSACPNHQVRRTTTLTTRANVAYFGTFGYELDLLACSDAEKAQITQQINFMKTYRELIQFGTFYRLKSPFEGNETIWMVVSSDQSSAIVAYYRTLQEVNVGYRRIPLVGLNTQAQYNIEGSDTIFYGDELMHIGLILSDESSGEIQSPYTDTFADFYSKLYILKQRV